MGCSPRCLDHHDLALCCAASQPTPNHLPALSWHMKYRTYQPSQTLAYPSTLLPKLAPLTLLAFDVPSEARARAGSRLHPRGSSFCCALQRDSVEAILTWSGSPGAIPCTNPLFPENHHARDHFCVSQPEPALPRGFPGGHRGCQQRSTFSTTLIWPCCPMRPC
jgi:hypothetical protein